MNQTEISNIAYKVTSVAKAVHGYAVARLNILGGAVRDLKADLRDAETDYAEAEAAYDAADVTYKDIYRAAYAAAEEAAYIAEKGKS